jgi:predicted transcriptional regulator
LAVRSATERVWLAMVEGLLQSTIKQFAASIGLTHEATYRALAELVENGRIQKQGRGRYSILKKES